MPNVSAIGPERTLVDRRGRLAAVTATALFANAFFAFAELTVWTGTGDWATSVANWSAGVPEAGDDVLIANGSVLLTNDTLQLASFSMTNGTLIFSNLSAAVRATNVWITRGTVTHVTNSATTTNASGEWPIDGRVYFVCTNFFLQNPGTIIVDTRGWQGDTVSGNGPGNGGADRAGAGYGGYGGNSADVGGAPYGSPESPDQPGSSGGTDAGVVGGTGGGMVRIEAGGTVTINGVISANGNTSGTLRGGGSGGGIWISCSTFAATNGALQVIGGNCGFVGGSGGGGGGGRIAIHYDPVAQASMPPAIMKMLASRGANIGGGYLGDIGTIYMTDAQLLRENLNYIEGQIFGPTAWKPSSLTISNAWVRFAQDQFALVVTNDILIDGGTSAITRLELGGGAVMPRSRAGYLIYSHEMNGSGTIMLGRSLYSAVTSSLTCGGNVVLTNGGEIRVYGGPTNAASDFGTVVDIKGNVYIALNSWIFSISQPTDGGSPLFRMKNLVIPNTGSGFNAIQAGFSGGGGFRQNGYGPGGGGSQAGGGYGGEGGYSGGGIYGISNAPIYPGSGGGREGATTSYSYSGGAGGGLIRLEISGKFALGGTLDATGGTGHDPVGGVRRPGAGSGGGIYVKCWSLEGTGSIKADGGRANAGYACGSGGGGRIAIMSRTHAGFSGTVSVEPGAGKAGYLGSTGTVVWVQMPEFSGGIVSMK